LVGTVEFIRYLTDVSTKVDTYQQPRGTGLGQSPLSQGAAAKRRGSGSW